MDSNRLKSASFQPPIQTSAALVPQVSRSGRIFGGECGINRPVIMLAMPPKASATTPTAALMPLAKAFRKPLPHSAPSLTSGTNTPATNAATGNTACTTRPTAATRPAMPCAIACKPAVASGLFSTWSSIQSDVRSPSNSGAPTMRAAFFIQSARFDVMPPRVMDCASMSPPYFPCRMVSSAVMALVLSLMSSPDAENSTPIARSWSRLTAPNSAKRDSASPTCPVEKRPR